MCAQFSNCAPLQFKQMQSWVLNRHTGDGGPGTFTGLGLGVCLVEDSGRSAQFFHIDSQKQRNMSSVAIGYVAQPHVASIKCTYVQFIRLAGVF